MERPLAKYEFVSNDLQEFIEMQAQLAAAKNNSGSLSQSAEVDLSDFKVVFSYFGYMPDTYSMFTDKPVDSATGVTFESRIIQTGDNEASLGFDYIFVNGQQTATTVQIAIYDSEGNQLSLTDPVEVPLARSCHSIMHGQFLLSNASGGIGIDPGFDGDHNIVIP